MTVDTLGGEHKWAQHYFSQKNKKNKGKINKGPSKVKEEKKLEK